MVHTSLQIFYAVPASPPDSVTAVNISSTAIQVSWNPVSAIDQNGVITEYEVEYNQTTFSEVSMYNTITVNSTTLMVDLTGLEEYVVYSIRVRAYTRVGVGPFGYVVMERTREDCKYFLFFRDRFFKYHKPFFTPAPASSPGNIMAVNISSTVIRVSWGLVPAIDQNGVITQYEVEFNQTTFSEVSMYNTTTVNSTTLMMDLTGLKEYVVYFIRVRAYTSVRAGPYSDAINVSTKEDSKKL